MQIRRSEVVYLSQDSMISSSQVNCTGTHLRGRTLLIWKLNRMMEPSRVAALATVVEGLILPMIASERALKVTGTRRCERYEAADGVNSINSRAFLAVGRECPRRVAAHGGLSPK